MPMGPSFREHLIPILPELDVRFGTPFHIYDEAGIRNTGEQLKTAFRRIEGFKEYFAVKALPNPHILSIMHDLGFGFDCSSIPELILARKAGGRGEELMFTSNNTSQAEFALAEIQGGCILNLDDISLIPKVPRMPRTICFRYNPGPRRTGNSIIGNPEEAKYGVAHDQIIDAYRMAMGRGACQFGLHTMLASNELNCEYIIQTTQMLLEMVQWIGAELGIRFDFINIGGGLGIPYRPEAQPFNLEALGKGVVQLFEQFRGRQGYAPRLFMESGRYMTGPHGALVVKAINRKEIYRTYVGVDACMSALMRPAMYGAYHHIDVVGKMSEQPTAVVDVVGSLCENNDKFAVQRPLPPIVEGDLLIIHDTGAHGHAMGFNYNGRLRPQELLLRCDGRVELIRRAETVEDYFATLNYEPHVYTPKGAGGCDGVRGN